MSKLLRLLTAIVVVMVADFGEAVVITENEVRAVDFVATVVEIEKVMGSISFVMSGVMVVADMS